MRVIAGDIGGTNARLAEAEVETGSGGGVEILRAQVFPSRDFSSLAEIVQRFSAGQSGAAQRACFAVPGPVRGGRAQTTNLPWTVESAALAEILGFEAVELCNDLEANAWGLGVLPPSDFVVLREGEADPEGNAALISAGTGLGQAGLFWDGTRHRPFASEGGHTDFAPADAREQALLDWLRARYPDHVSWERVLCGPGLHNLYRFLRDSGHAPEQAAIAEALKTGDPPAVIGRAAAEGRCELCREALALFVRFYGAEAGNLALTLLATAGVYLGGGIAPKIVDALRSPAFLEAFDAKGRLSPVMQKIPIRLVTNDQTALVGAAHVAAR